MGIADIFNATLCAATPRGGESAKKRRLSDAECVLIDQAQHSLPSTPRQPQPQLSQPALDSPYMSDNTEENDEDNDNTMFAVSDMVASLPSSPTSPAQRRCVIAKRRDRPACLRQEEQAILAAARGQHKEHPHTAAPLLRLQIPTASVPHPCRYTRHEKLGEGQYGEVHRATDTHTGTMVAVKMLHNRCRGECYEAAAMRACGEHRNVLRLVDTYIEDHRHVLVTDLAQGDLLTQLQQRGPVDESRARTHGEGLVSAVLALHSAGYCHRDVKLENLLVSFNGEILLGDFGCAEPLNSEDLGSAVGSPAYMPPEAHLGEGCDGEAADVWSIGVVLYAMVAGEFPFEMATPDCKRFEQFMQGKNEWPPHFSEPFRKLLRAVLAPASTRISLAEVEAHPWLATH